MIISKSRKFAFFRVPKTGSVTAEFLLRILLRFDPEDVLSAMPYAGLPARNTNTDRVGEFIERTLSEVHAAERTAGVASAMSRHRVLGHMTPGQAVECGLVELDDLRRMKSYVFIREPLSRFESALRYYYADSPDPGQLREILRDRSMVRKLIGTQCAFVYRNGERLVEPLLFDNFNTHMTRIISLQGGRMSGEVPRMNHTVLTRRSQGRECSLDDATKDALRQIYREDFELYAELSAARE